MRIKTLFIGSNWEALETLRTLYEDDRFDIVGIITQPDKPVGRKQEILPTEVKQFGLDHGIDVFHTMSNHEKYKEALEKFEPELILCKSFGEILPEFFLEAPKYKTINVHYSLLPKYRGAVPIQSAILAGDKETGISIVKMVKKMDAGPVLAQLREEIRPDDTNQSLRERLVALTCSVLPDILEKWCQGKIATKDQNEKKASYCWKDDISKDKAFIDLEKDDVHLAERKVRAFLPWPVAWTIINGKRVKIFKAEVTSIAGKRDVLRLLEVQVEGKRVMGERDFLNWVGKLVGSEA